jgi:hypothetical protein
MQRGGISRTIRAKIKSKIGEPGAQENEKKAFFVGGNSSCRVHIRQHYDIYRNRCKEGNIPENHHAIPRQIFLKMKVDKKGTAAQSTLDGVLGKPAYMKLYTREGAMHAIAQLVACDDQVRKMVMLCIEIDDLRPGSCAH